MKALDAEVKTRSSWRDNLSIHPAAELFPLMTSEELKTTGADIVKNGFTAPIALWRADPKSPAQLLDGRNRLDAIELATGKVVEIGAPSVMAGDFLATDAVIVLDGRKVDPWGYVSSANVLRRHLTPEGKREVIAKFLLAQPEKSDRQIGKMAEADNKTVAVVRGDLERREEIPHVKARTDTKGRQQPATKAKKAKPPAEKKSAKSEPEPVEPITTASKGDIGVTSTDEVEQLRARNKELENKCRHLEIKVEGLESEVEKLRAENAALRKAKATSASNSNGGAALGEALADAFSEIEAVGEECGNTFENAPENLRESDRYCAFDNTAETLGALEVPDIAPELAAIKIDLPKSRRARSYSARLGVALDAIDAGIAALDDINEDDSLYPAAHALSGELEDVKAEIEGCDVLQ
jgi:hypothetical protein